MWIQKLGHSAQGIRETTDDAVREIFALKLEHMRAWLVEWGEERKLGPWEHLHDMAEEMWAIGCAVVITALWRWRVDKKYYKDMRSRTEEEQVRRTRRMIGEAFARRKLSLYPVTQTTITKMHAADTIMQRWKQDTMDVGTGSPESEHIRVGMFDGGSRGNPGPGGSGSWFRELEDNMPRPKVTWAAATALGHQETTNNVAEFIGLHRLLAKAVEQGWKKIHVVGDSALILGMMRERRPPKARKLQHWCRISRRLADICAVASWSHHYRRYNKVADWLANRAMDSKASKTWEVGDEIGRQALTAS